MLWCTVESLEVREGLGEESRDGEDPRLRNELRQFDCVLSRVGLMMSLRIVLLWEEVHERQIRDRPFCHERLGRRQELQRVDEVSDCGWELMVIWRTNVLELDLM